MPKAPPAEPVKPPTEAPEALQPMLDLLTKPLALILVAKQIPWVVQAKLAREGYVTVEDLGDRWNTPEDARAQGPRDLELGRTISTRPPLGLPPCACFRRSGQPSQWPRRSSMWAAPPPQNPQAQPRAPLTASATGRSWRLLMLRHIAASNQGWNLRAVMPI